MASSAIMITELTGGLGNQMFQYALGRALSLRTDAKLLFDTRALARDNQRSYALSGFRIDGRVALASELPLEWGPITRRLPWLSRITGGPRLIAEREFTFDPMIVTLAPPIALHGNWQSEKYFCDIAPIITADFSLSRPLDSRRQELATEIVGAPAAVSVHVRRGDYVSNRAASAYHGTCEPAWYSEAKRRMDIAVNDATYFVFSDDVTWAQSSLPEFVGCRFIEPSQDGRDECDLYLMSLCNHHIIANSSFSWWGAWLSGGAHKRVVAPARWFAGAKHDTRDLIPSSWDRL